jgi:peptidyl-prolyl cis-trans isomerase SurA
MKKFLHIIPVCLALFAGSCSSAPDVGNYLWGDDEPSKPQARSGGGAVSQPALAQSPTSAQYAYTSDAGGAGGGQSGFSKLPKNSQRALVIVNDQPITGYDITQRQRLNRVLGQRRGNSRKAVLKELIDGVIQISEAKRNKVRIDDNRVETAIKSMAKSVGSTPAKLKARLKSKGVAYSSLKSQVKSTLALRWLMQSKGAQVGEVSDGDVDRRLRKLNSDPRRQGVTVYLLRQINLPVENVSSAMGGQLLQARAVEAQQIAAKYRGCSSLRRASNGIYNVKLSNTIQADGRKLPPQMKKALRQAGRRKLIGPMRVRSGIQLIAFCGTKRVEPPKVTRAQVKAVMQNEKFGNAADRIMQGLRRKAFIDYKVPSARP